MISSPSLALAQGGLTMAGLIVAIGAQNALELRQGPLRAHVGPVVTVCSLSDWLLTAVGVFGLGELVAARRWRLVWRSPECGGASMP